MSRFNNYVARLPDEATLTAILTARKPAMLDSLSVELMTMENIEALVRGTLAGISGGTAPTKAQSAAYQAACKQMYRVSMKWTGGTMFDTDMAAIIAKWAARGLSSVVLTQLAYEVFHWSPPTP